MNQRFDKMDQKFDQRFDKVNQRLDEQDNFQEIVMKNFAKVFDELSGVKADILDLKSDVTVLKSDVSGLNKTVARMETEINEKLDALYHDWRVDQNRINVDTQLHLVTLETKVEELQLVSNKHDIEIKKLNAIN